MFLTRGTNNELGILDMIESQPDSHCLTSLLKTNEYFIRSCQCSPMFSSHQITHLKMPLPIFVVVCSSHTDCHLERLCMCPPFPPALPRYRQHTWAHAFFTCSKTVDMFGQTYISWVLRHSQCLTRCFRAPLKVSVGASSRQGVPHDSAGEVPDRSLYSVLWLDQSLPQNTLRPIF